MSPVDQLPPEETAVPASEPADAARRKKLEILGKAVEANQAIALASIQAQREHSENLTRSEERREGKRLLFWALVVVVGVAFCCCALFLNKEDVVIKLGEIVAAFIAGYFTGRNGKQPPPPNVPT